MNGREFEARIVEWARQQSDIKALVQIGSRALGDGKFDALSDWDFYLISNRPSRYHRLDWLAMIAPPWCINLERSLRGGTMKVTAVFDGGFEVDFVLLAAWQMKLVYWGMKHPELAKWMPTKLHRGILETRRTLTGSGYKVLVGGDAWENRFKALGVPWPSPRLSAEEFVTHLAAFWQKSVWVAKKIARPEPRSAMHWLHKLVVEHVYCLLEEEARLAGKRARPEALKAEKWLDARRLEQTNIATSTDQRVLARALLSEIALFEEVSRSVATSRGFPLKDYSAIATWLRAELGKITDAP